MTARTTQPQSARSLARLAATQALYQMLLTGTTAEDVVAEFRNFRGVNETEGSTLTGADQALFADIVRGACARQDEIEALLSECLVQDWPLARLETTLRAVLWAGAYELLARPDIPLVVVINEYVEIAHGFFAEKEPAFVNGVLDRLAHKVRPSTPEAAAGGGSAR
ncbi:MAG: transcription antitermination factor NusB [Alphaproteobacteria bacterium]